LISRDNLLLLLSIIITIGIGIYSLLIQGNPERLTLILPLISILLVSVIMLYFIASAETRLKSTLDRRLPPLEHLENKDDVDYELVRLARTAKRFIVATGGRSRNVEYLKVIKQKVESGQVNYWRILFGSGITHEMCEHLTSLLGMPGVQIGQIDEPLYDHMLVTDSGYLDALPVPGHAELMGVKVSSTLISEQLFHYIMRVYQKAEIVTKPEEIQILCERCHKNKNSHNYN